MDDKRFIRKLKQENKKTGNRKRRRFLKDLSSDPGDFDFGSEESSALNGRDGKNRKRKEKDKPALPDSESDCTTDSTPDPS